jgi:hypothetical protein
MLNFNCRPTQSFSEHVSLAFEKGKPGFFNPGLKDFSEINSAPK